jgi:PadR family transcriptional regulator PadR
MLKGHLDLLLLAVLLPEAAHGDAIIEGLRRASGGTFDLPEGTVYPALHKLELDGLLASEWSEETGRRRRRIYAITEKGRAAFQAQQEEWNRFVQGIEAVLREAQRSDPVLEGVP